MTGHLLGGAGAIEAIACEVAINENFIPPTINHFNDDPEIDSEIEFYFQRGTRKGQSMLPLAILFFWFWGHNASLIVKKI